MSETPHHRDDFNPRSHEGSDFLPQIFRHITIYFNPRSHEGSDCRKHLLHFTRLVISIHAPTKGATPPICYSFPQSLISIHAPTKGATQDKRVWSKALGFQSTLPRRERPLLPRYAPLCAHFNPRSHEGSDFHIICISPCHTYFNPRSHEGSDGS